MERAYIFLADGFEETEAIAPVDLLRRAGVDVVLVSMNDTKTVTGSHQIKITADAVFTQYYFDDAALLILPGGRVGTENLENNEALADLLVSANRKGVTLAAICAAPRVLGQLGLLRGKEACCYPGNEALLLDAKVVFTPVAAADGVITSRGMGTAFQFGLALVRHLCGDDTAAEVANRTVYSD